MLAAALRSALGRILPRRLRLGASLWPVLAEIDRDIAAISTAKGRLYSALRKRFPETEAKVLTLKVSNMMLARCHRRARSLHVTSRPFGLVLDPSNMCQLACPGCVHSTRNEALGIFDWKPGTLSEARFSALLRSYGPWAAGAYLCNYGEPLLNLATPKLIRACKSYLMGAALSTSLSVRRFDAEAYVKSGLDFMNISIDGATQPVYEMYRRNGDLDLVFRNIRALVQARADLRRRAPVMSWNFLAFEHNRHEIPLAAAKARELGVDQFRVIEPFDVSWDDPSVRAAAGVDARAFTRLNLRGVFVLSENFNPFPDSLESAIIEEAFDEPLLPPGPQSAQTAGHTCAWLYKNLVMDATGRVLPCCYAPQPGQNMVFTHFDPSGPEPLADLFNSRTHQQARALFRTDTPVASPPPYCAHCEWDQEHVNIDKSEVGLYFRCADPLLFDSRSIQLLTDW